MAFKLIGCHEAKAAKWRARWRDNANEAALVAAHELGLAGKLNCVRSLEAMNTPNPAIMADNPLSKIPTLVLDDGSVLLDSDVIVEYLDNLGGGKLFPETGPARWETLSHQALASGLLDGLILWRNEREKPTAQLTEAWLSSFAAKTQAERRPGSARRSIWRCSTWAPRSSPIRR